MNQIFLTDISEALNDADAFIAYALPKMSNRRKEKINRLKVTGDKVRCAACGLLLNMAYSDYNGADSIPVETECKNGRPITGDPDFHYSLSHSDKICGIIWSDKNCGIDIQAHVPLKQDIAGRFFHSDEKKYIEETNDKSLVFDIWCAKEALIKYDGKGLSYGLDKFSTIPLIKTGEVVFNDKTLYGNISRPDEGSYSLAYVGETPDFSVNKYLIKFN
jgi:phosphopantetheinyl transferase